MDTRMFFLGTALAATLVGGSASASQQEPRQPATGEAKAGQVVQCTQAQPRVVAGLDAALKRLDEARQTNSPAVMRAAADDIQAALLDVRAQLAPCADMQVAAADPHAEHATAIAPPPAAARQAAQSRQPQQPSGTSRTTIPSITFRTIPNPPRGAAENEFEVTVTDRQGKPVDGADVSLLWYMAAMPATNMPAMRNEVQLRGVGAGKYSGKGQVVMSGPWTVTVTVKQNGREIGQDKITVTAR